jgi:hypothetical protein
MMDSPSAAVDNDKSRALSFTLSFTTLSFRGGTLGEARFWPDRKYTEDSRMSQGFVGRNRDGVSGRSCFNNGSLAKMVSRWA